KARNADAGRQPLRPKRDAGVTACAPLFYSPGCGSHAQKSAGTIKRRDTIWYPSVLLFRNDWCCKPGSVVDGHLSGTRVAARLKPPVGTAGQAIVPVGVAADRVYRPPVLPRGA